MHQKIIEKLYNKYKVHGYIEEESVFNELIENNLPLDEINILCNKLLDMGVIIKTDDYEDSQVFYDLSRTDYEKLYNDVIEIDDSLKQLINEIKEIKPPQPNEWKNLLISAQGGNDYARDRLISMYIRLVVKIALWHYKKYGIILADAIQNGCLGLITALEKFELGRHNNFSQHASLWIRQVIMRNMNLPNTLLYFPFHYKEKLFIVYDIYENHYCESCDKNQYCPNLIRQISEVINCNYKLSQKMIDQLIQKISLEELFELDECIFTDKGEFENQMIGFIDFKQLPDNVEQIFKRLKPNEEKILNLRYGFNGNEEKTLEAIGQTFKVTRERIRQIEVKAIKKISKMNQNKKLKGFWENY